MPKIDRVETEEQAHRITVLLCNAIIDFNNTNVLPSAKSIEEMFYIAVVLFVIELICHLLKIYTFISLYGALVNLVLLTILMLKEKHEDNIITRSYAKARTKITKEIRSHETKRTKHTRNKRRKSA